jgi:hypothetical protein
MEKLLNVSSAKLQLVDRVEIAGWFNSRKCLYPPVVIRTLVATLGSEGVIVD